MIVAATMLEYTASPLLGLYTYRLHNVPSFVPPGHGLVYLAALTIGGAIVRHPRRRLVPARRARRWRRLGVLGPRRSAPAGRRAAPSSTSSWPRFILRGRAPLVYAAAFVVTAYLEIVGTNVGTWAWSHHGPLGYVSLGNPPSGIAGGYCFLDMVGIYVAARLARVHPSEVVLEPLPEPAVAPQRCDSIRRVSTTLPLDLERYPIDDLDGGRARALIADCRSQLERTGLCLLPGFLGPDAVARSVAELEPRVEGAFRKERAIVAMNESEIDSSLPLDDPVRTAHRHSMRTIAYDLID